MLNSVPDSQMTTVAFSVGGTAYTMSAGRDRAGATWSGDYAASRVLELADAYGRGESLGEAALTRFTDEYMAWQAGKATKAHGYRVPKTRMA